ncbi:MAG: type II secretion system protein [Sulfurimonadaceae bacterium]|jgi:prepilin-type N-terminal cleavage/methylation domain-containing protein|nr:type II secretion system protein [Sulfurimonadaceae bacterium]
MKKNGFTMIELIFVIIVLGILAAIALPKFGGMKGSADIAKGRADIATLNSTLLNKRQSTIMLGSASWMSKGAFDAEVTKLSGWSVTSSGNYKFSDCTLSYDGNGTFGLSGTPSDECKKLTN